MLKFISENSRDADNQQERLIKLGWITGFVDGEGCFSVSLVKQMTKTNRKGYKTGYQVFCEFAVTQGARSLDSLELLQAYFQVGRIYKNSRHDNHREHIYRYVVRDRTQLKKVIIPFFDEFNLRTVKRLDFERFKLCLKLIEEKKHLTKAGLVEILKIQETMNRKKSRQEEIRILRDCTPDIQDIE